MKKMIFTSISILIVMFLNCIAGENSIKQKTSPRQYKNHYFNILASDTIGLKVFPDINFYDGNGLGLGFDAVYQSNKKAVNYSRLAANIRTTGDKQLLYSFGSENPEADNEQFYTWLLSLGYSESSTNFYFYYNDYYDNNNFGIKPLLRITRAKADINFDSYLNISRYTKIKIGLNYTNRILSDTTYLKSYSSKIDDLKMERDEALGIILGFEYDSRSSLYNPYKGSYFSFEYANYETTKIYENEHSYINLELINFKELIRQSTIQAFRIRLLKMWRHPDLNFRNILGLENAMRGYPYSYFTTTSYWLINYEIRHRFGKNLMVVLGADIMKGSDNKNINRYMDYTTSNEVKANVVFGFRLIFDTMVIRSDFGMIFEETPNVSVGLGQFF